ncbi:MAG: hypothetical protein M3O50_16010, partial [Myxococcota bacterium]|nr:hypothetical protein [Myxococcota bacterium]
DASRALEPASPRAAAAVSTFVASPTPPDPSPLSARQQWILDLRWDRGDVWLLGVRALDLPTPRVTPRAMGRFALELYEGQALLERVRFDFPLMAAPEAHGAPSLGAHLRTRIGVVFPATSRGTRFELLDRAIGHRWSIPWPPPQSRDLQKADADGRPPPPPDLAQVRLPVAR